MAREGDLHGVQVEELLSSSAEGNATLITVPTCRVFLLYFVLYFIIYLYLFIFIYIYIYNIDRAHYLIMLMRNPISRSARLT